MCSKSLQVPQKSRSVKRSPTRRLQSQKIFHLDLIPSNSWLGSQVDCDCRYQWNEEWIRDKQTYTLCYCTPTTWYSCSRGVWFKTSILFEEEICHMLCSHCSRACQIPHGHYFLALSQVLSQTFKSLYSTESIR